MPCFRPGHGLRPTTPRRGRPNSETGTAADAAGTDTADGATAGTAETDKGGVDATTGNQGPWAPEIGNALFAEGFTGMREADDAKSRWTALSAENQNTVKADCDRFQAAGMTGQTALVQTGMDPISTTDMTALCTMVSTF